MAELHKKIPHVTRWFDLGFLCTHPQYRRRGIGHQLAYMAEQVGRTTARCGGTVMIAGKMSRGIAEKLGMTTWNVRRYNPDGEELGSFYKLFN